MNSTIPEETSPLTIAPLPTVPDPNVIELTVSEIDRQTASYYYNRHHCLVCTALRNRGFNLHSAAGTWVEMEDGEWRLERDGGASQFATDEFGRAPGPYFTQDVVGRVIRLRRASGSAPSVGRGNEKV